MNSYGVRCIFECPKAGFNTLNHLYEERITVWTAETEDEAIDKAIEEAESYAKKHRCTYAGLAQSFWMFTQLDINGVEVFSLLRESNLEVTEYLNAFFSTRKNAKEPMKNQPKANKAVKTTPLRSLPHYDRQASIHPTTKHRIFTTSFASVSPLYVAKAGKKGRTKSEVDAIICWLTGSNPRELEAQLKEQKDFEIFFKEAPKLNPSRTLIKGVVCGIQVENIQEPTMREIRYLDKLIDELAKGKAMEKILRT